jgi:hypothetical protein
MNVPGYGRFFIDPLFRVYFNINMFTNAPGRHVAPATLFASETKVDTSGIVYHAAIDNSTGSPGNVMTSLNMKLSWLTLNVPQIPPMALDCYSECLGKGAPQAKIY